jgi:hypothetical protein
MFWLFCVFNTIATLYCTGWDYYMDWGLIRSTEPGKYGLRPKIRFPARFYYFAMVVNLILRFFWVLGVFTFAFDTKVGDVIDQLALMTFFSMMAEALRRTQWSLIRVENEFFNNFEQYRTIPIIPKLMDDVADTLNRFKDTGR